MQQMLHMLPSCCTHFFMPQVQQTAPGSEQTKQKTVLSLHSKRATVVLFTTCMHTRGTHTRGKCAPHAGCACGVHACGCGSMLPHC